MVRNFTFLLYLVCLLIAIAYPANLRQPAKVTIYAVEGTTVEESPEAITAAENNPGEDIIVLPQLPATEVYTPNSIKDFKTGDPAEAINLIKAPTPNPSGNAVLNFAMKIPEGRMGLQPDFAISYNNEGSGSWLGTGWSMNMPAVGIETRWGSPRYDPAWETEMYTLNGELLAPMNNRSQLVARGNEKRFYKRVEGSFSRIIRHGTHPSNYWWEITEKDGTHYCYGGRPGAGVVANAVLRDDQNNIAYWALVETRDVGDNFVRYEYTQVDDPGIVGSTVAGRQLYPNRVFYTGFGNTDGPYSIEFIRDRQLGESRRVDVSIDARFGFKMVNADLLRRVNISLNGQLIRSYNYTYATGAFDKTLLTSISELDDAGAVFYTHNFDYYDDVNKQNYDPATTDVAWAIANDNMKGDIVNPIPGFTAEASAIGTSKAKSISGGAAVGVGSLTGGTWSKNTTVGGGFNYGEDDQEGIVALIDINGDGLPDKVIKEGNNLYYRANLGGAAKAFGEKMPIIGVNNFSTSNSKNIGGGAEVVPPAGFLGYNHTSTTTTTKIYFSDFNGDGLMDIADNGRVFFNHIDESTGNPTFTLNSGDTPSPIFSGSIDNSFLTPDTALQRRQEMDFPLQDIVRVWQAPFTGTVSVTAPAQLVNIPGVAHPKKDGVRLSIQYDAVVLDSVYIDENDFTVKNFNIASLGVTKGQNLYFRVQSRYNGHDDEVSWDPIIQYTTPVVQNSDVQHKTSNYYRASEDFILHSKGATGMGKDGQIIIEGTFEKQVTSDTVTIMITRDRNSVYSTVFQRDYAPGELATGDLLYPGNLPVLEGDQLFFRIVSRSYIDRSAMLWKPHYEYVAFAPGDTTPLMNNNGVPTMHGYPVPDNSNFNSWERAVAPAMVSTLDTMIVRPQISSNGALDGTLWFTIKGIDTVYARRKVLIAGGAMSPVDSIVLIRQPGVPLYYEYATDSIEFANTLNAAEVSFYRDSIYWTGADPDTTRLRDTALANLYTNPEKYLFGPLFRGWGQFALKGDKGNGPINQDSLNLDELENMPSDPGNFTDSTQFPNLPDPSKTSFVMLFPDGQKNMWVGYDTCVFVTGNNMRSARLWMYDVSVDSLMAGESAGAVHKVSKTETESFSGGLSSFSASVGTSWATTITQLDMMDMNGDRYPDVMNGENIQYTLPHGGLGTTVIWQPVGNTESYGFSKGLSLGGSFIQASTENKTKTGAKQANKTAETSSGLSGSVNQNDDEALSSWIDINGDGLTDRVYQSGVVQLNLGYRFAPGENWGLEAIDEATSNAFGAGMGVNIDAGSYEAGIGLSRTEGDNTFGLNDVNGDGLPDQLFYNIQNSSFAVRLNTGTGFGPRIPWSNYTGITRNISTGESINGAFTIVIPIPIPFFPIKITINPSFNAGQGVSKQEKAVMDLDGDGYADMLDSDNDGDLSATVSKIGRTNMLRNVRGPLGGYFSMDYQRVGNSYDMPQSKWVLSGVEVFDGVPGDGVDTMRQRFIYENGFQDRHEREFYGFRRVITRDLNTANNNIVYRSRVQEFTNGDYYTKGLLSTEWVEDGAGRKFTQTFHTYKDTLLQPFVKWPALMTTTKQFFEGEATAGVTTSTAYRYDAYGNIISIVDAGDGQQQDMIFANITYHDLNSLYLKNIPASIEVITAAGTKRRRTTTVNSTGNITRIREFLADGSFADTDMEYDTYSNLRKITRPANYKGQRMFHEYEYDDVAHQYITRVSDAFGYSSTSTYDYRFGLVTGTVSMNNEETRFTIDNRGRLSSVTGPYELAAGKAYTIAYEYDNTAPVPYALTRHYDPEHNADIVLVSFVDGLGRIIQDKKQVSIYKGRNVADQLSMQVSGATFFDAFGRGVEQYYSVIEPMGTERALNGGLGNPVYTTAYDVLDRKVKTVLSDGAETNAIYTADDNLFSAVTTDALGNSKELKSDARGRKRFFTETGPNGAVATRYEYNAISELVRVVDNSGNAFSAAYDNLGRRISTEHPDGGRTEFEYDLAGNLLKKITAQVKKEIPNGGAIQYQYEFDRLTDIDYPRHYQNKVKLSYGAAGTGNKAGRLILQQDGSGGQEFFYGLQGELVKTIRTVLVNQVLSVTYVSEQEFDTWNRVKKIKYADGEVVTYKYNRAGKLSSMEGVKQGHVYKYVEQLGYDEFEDRVYLRYGNGVENQYAYENQRRRLTQLRAATASGKALMNNAYTYDAVSNVLGIVNNGTTSLNYHYDNLYRVDSASGQSSAGSFGVKVEYDDLSNITHKNMQSSPNSYDHAYTYATSRAHQVAQVGERIYKHDANGNQLGYGDLENFFDEENRLMGVINKGVLCQYTYDAEGRRVIKSSGGMQSIWLNGAPAGTVKHNDNYSIDVNPFITCRAANFTKHYYIEGERIASKLGHGRFTNINFPRPLITAGGIDYNKRAAMIEKARQEYYASLGVSPGPPTDKNFWARPENSGIPAPVYVDTGAYSTPSGWPGNTTPPPDGPPVFVDSIPSNDSVKAGFGFRDPGQLYEVSQFFFHPDHLSSTNYMTHVQGEMSQHTEYSPFGEVFAMERQGSFATPYLFHGQSFDEETGYYFYGDRYYDPELSQWLSIGDPFGDNFAFEYNNLYVNMALLMDDAVSALSGAGSSSQGGSGTVMNLSGYKLGEEGGGGDGGGKDGKDGKGGKKGGAEAKSGNAGFLGKSGNRGKPSGAGSPGGIAGAHKRGFRGTGKGAVQHNGMFFGYQKQKYQDQKKGGIQGVKTRPRR